MFNYKLTIQYDGSGYSGWQIQNNAKSVQQTLTDALFTLTKQNINLVGSGRTDSGVHALGQVANFRIEEKLDLYKFNYSLNSILPDDIVVSKMEEIHYDFHARFDARRRTYIYLITQKKSPFYKNYSHQYFGTVDLNKLNELSSAFICERDFTSFSKKNDEIENKNCKIVECKWFTKNEVIIFKIAADRFLHGMVRAITGTLLRAMDLNQDKKHILELFENLDRETVPMSVPAKGLYLYKVDY